jgi:hypothetical protein
MSVTPSEIARRIAGTYIEDDRSPKPPLSAWIQSECRAGCFREALLEAIKEQDEPLSVELAVVEKIDADKIMVRIPCRVADHESTSTFELDVHFELNPLTQKAQRV